MIAVAARLSLGAPELGIAITGPMHRMEAIESKLGDLLMQCVRRVERHDTQRDETRWR